MKRFLKGKWHRIPVALVSSLLVLFMVAGGALAAYNFLVVHTNITVKEAIILSVGANDDLPPYMADANGNPNSGVLPAITIAEDGTITVVAGTSDASELCPGETLIIPVNLRNRSDGALVLAASVTSDAGSYISVEGAVVGLQSYAALSGWTYTIAGHEGAFGSAGAGATVLNVKITVANDAPPVTYTIIVTFSRN